MSTIISAITSVITALSTLLVSIFGYAVDLTDTTKNYRERVAGLSVYENAIETALPQTVIYDVISEHFNSPLPEGKTEKKAVIIGFDGGRADSLDVASLSNGGSKLLLENGGKAYIGYAGGVNYPEKNRQDTSTAPGWCSILTGEWADVTGIYENGVNKSNDCLTLLTTLVQSGKADSSMFQTSWGGHFVNDNSTYRLEKEYCEENNLNVTFTCNSDDAGTHSGMMLAVSQQDCPDFIFGIYEYMDHCGHGSGFSANNPKYKQAYLDDETAAYELINAIQSRGTYAQEDWLIVIASDHGGKGLTHGGRSIQERMTFIVCNKEINL